MSKSTETLDPMKFNYALFKSDLNAYCKRTGYTQTYISTNMLYRSGAYLYNALSKKMLPPVLMTRLCEIMDTKASKYMIKDEKEEKNEAIPVSGAPAKVIDGNDKVISMPIDTDAFVSKDTGWECRIRVDEDFETVMMKILKNGEEMAISRCYFFSKDDVGIIQAISYAAHQCYKAYQQTEFARKEASKYGINSDGCSRGTDEDLIADDTVSFKNWILKFKGDPSRLGGLARYCETMFSTMPNHGERKLRMFFQMDKDGREHLDAFNAIWPLYLKEARRSSLNS